MSFKKIVLTAGFLAMALFIFNFGIPGAQAMTTAEIQTLIQSLQQQIAQLQQQLTESEEPSVFWCYTFNTNLKIGDNGKEIGELKTALIKNGVWPYEAVSYDFDEETASYVVAFQEKYKSEILTPYGLKSGTGYVGKGTRAKLNALFGCSETEYCPQVITSAKNPLTGECKDFPTPCDVPTGWDKTGNCFTPIATVGSLSLSLSAETPATAIQAVGSAGDTLDNVVFEKVDFRASTEDIDIKSITIKRAGGRDADFATVSLWDGSTQLGSDQSLVDYAGESSTVFAFPAYSYWRIPKGVTKTLTIKAELYGIGDSDNVGSSTGDHPKLCVKANGVSSQGVESGSTIASAPSPDLCGNEMVIRRSKPTIASASLPSSVLSAGEKVLYRWTVSADAKGNVGWQKIKFNMTGTLRGNPISASTITNLKVWNLQDSTQVAGTVSGLATFEAASEQVVPAGTTKTYELRGTVLMAPTGDDYIMTKINNEGTGTTVTGSYSYISGETASSFVWTDRSAASHSASTFDWTNDYRVSGIPTSALSLIYGGSGPIASIAVISPNGGEQLTIGQTYIIKWSSQNLNTVAGINLIDYTSGSRYGNQYGIASSVSASLGQYSWTVPSSVTPGSYYKISAGYESTNDFSDNYFSIYSLATSTVACTDSDGGTNYYVKGTTVGMAADNVLSTDTDYCVGSNLVEWFCSGIYRTNTNYTCAHGCQDGACIQATTTPSVTVLSPNGGETWQIGQTYTVTWKSSGVETVDISLDDYRAGPSDVLRVNGISASLGSYALTIPANNQWITPGNAYQIQVIAPKESISDSSNGYFSIIAAASNLPPTTPVITLWVPKTNVNQPQVIYMDSKDPDGGSNYTLVCSFDWGDGTQSTYTAAYSGQTGSLCGEAHTWTKTGSYTITGTTKDSKGALSPVGSLTVDVVDPNAAPVVPATPVTVTGNEILRPNGAGSETSIDVQYTIGDAHWDKVDEASADGDSTYVENKNGAVFSYQRDLYAIQNHSAGSGTINKVVITARQKHNAPTGSGLKISLKTHGVIYDYDYTEYTQSVWHDLSHEMTVNPYTGAAWTWDEVDALEAGVSLGGSVYSPDWSRVTQVYVKVEYASVTSLEIIGNQLAAISQALIQLIENIQKALR